MKIRRLASFAALTGFGVLAFTFGANPQVSAATCTWNGSNNDNMYNSANWVDCQSDIPQDGDTVVFPQNAVNKNVVNNFPNDRTFNTVQFTGSGYNVTGTALPISNILENDSNDGMTPNDVTSGVVFSGFNGASYILAKSGSLNIDGNVSNNTTILEVNVDSLSNVTIFGVISGSGGITKTSSGVATFGANNTYTGVTTIGGVLYINKPNGLGTTAGNTVIQPHGTLAIAYSDEADTTFGEPLLAYAYLNDDRTSIELYGSQSNPTLNITGPIEFTTLNVSNDETEVVNIRSSLNLTISGPISGNASFKFLDTIPFSAPDTPKGTLKITGPSTLEMPILTDGLYVVDSDQGSLSVNVLSAGVLKGTGKIGALTVESGGRVAPGNSPGILTVGNTTFAAGSFFDVEIAGNTVGAEYDQLKVVGTVNLGGTSLNTTFLNNFRPAVNGTYTIIDNDAADAVTGTFKDLPEGASVTVDGVVLKVSYIGGDGNDVVLTVVGGTNVAGAPTTPNTGVQFMMANPIVTLVGTVVSAGSLMLLSRKYSLFTK